MSRRKTLRSFDSSGLRGIENDGNKKTAPEGGFVEAGSDQPILNASESDFELSATLTGCW